jgi:cobalamin biosynthesis Co2+ chelatase CbiK
MALLEVSESLSLLNRDHDERVQASIEAKQGLASEFKDRDSYNAFYRDKVLPSLKQHCIVGNLHLEDHISELL